METMEKNARELENMLYTVKECSKILKCSVPFVHQLRKAGLIRFMKLGSYKCRKEELQRFLAEMEGKDVTDPFHVKELDSDCEKGETMQQVEGF